jgi:threonine aldolase
MINLYSDTQTLPTDAMRQAMAAAELGDDVLGADPTVNRLEAESARIFGKEAALLVPSGTMANVIALLSHGGAGDEVYLDLGAHVYNYEAGSLCSIAGYTPRFVRAERGRMDPDSLREAIRPEDAHFPRPRLLWLENTHNVGGGTVLPPALQSQLVAIAREHGLKVHLDGARVFNAAVALGLPVAKLVEDVDSVSFCLSKGLSCPVGSLVVGGAEFIHRARRVRKRLGGGMRQAGVIAACGLVALKSMVERLADDHRHARELARALAGTSGLGIRPEWVETNMIFLDISGWGVDCFAAQAALEREGVLVSEMDHHTLRIVTHRHFEASQIPEVAAAFERVGKAFVGARHKP